jgi:hypothetical protein
MIAHGLGAERIERRIGYASVVIAIEINEIGITRIVSPARTWGISQRFGSASLEFERNSSSAPLSCAFTNRLFTVYTFERGLGLI